MPLYDFAPITGVWIETELSQGVKSFSLRTHHGCVDWNVLNSAPISARAFAPITGVWIETSTNKRAFKPLDSHPSRVCGLKLCYIFNHFFASVRTHHGCVDWNICIGGQNDTVMIRTHHGCVDWNLDLVGLVWPLLSHPSRVCGLKHRAIILSGILFFRTHHGCVDWNIIGALIPT